MGSLCSWQALGSIYWTQATWDLAIPQAHRHTLGLLTSQLGEITNQKLPYAQQEENQQRNHSIVTWQYTTQYPECKTYNYSPNYEWISWCWWGNPDTKVKTGTGWEGLCLSAFGGLCPPHMPEDSTPWGVTIRMVTLGEGVGGVVVTGRGTGGLLSSCFLTRAVKTYVNLTC